MSCTLPPGKDGLLQPVSSTSRADAICHPCCPSVSSPHEGVLVVGGCMWIGSWASWRKEGVGHTRVLLGAVSLEGHICSDAGVSSGRGSVQKGGHHGHQPDRLGWCSRGTVSVGQLECGSPALSHKFSGTPGGVPVPATLSSITEGPPCPGTGGQGHHSGLHQPSGGLTYAPIDCTF